MVAAARRAAQGRAQCVAHKAYQLAGELVEARQAALKAAVNLARRYHRSGERDHRYDPPRQRLCHETDRFIGTMYWGQGRRRLLQIEVCGSRHVQQNG